MAQFSLAWQAHKQNICHGLSALQQNGEFVDMTIAADGHHVKVHQMIMSLVSPYIKELIIAAQCPHPVIILNKVSYTILCAILEYIYTGEVVIDKENLNDLIEAGKELHIKGLEDMKIEISINPTLSQTMLAQANSNIGQPLSETGFFDKPTPAKIETRKSQREHTVIKLGQSNTSLPDLEESDDHHNYDDQMDITEYEDTSTNNTTASKTTDGNGKVMDPSIQYTVSNQGALQMVLNRNLYYLRYTSKKTENGGSSRSWKCINYQKKKTACPASVITRDDIVVKRFGAHNHPFHDKQILRKVRDGAVYTRINEAEEFGHKKKAYNAALPNKPTKGDTTTDAE